MQDTETGDVVIDFLQLHLRRDFGPNMKRTQFLFGRLTLFCPRPRVNSPPSVRDGLGARVDAFNSKGIIHPP